MAELNGDAIRQMASLSGVQLSAEELDLMQSQVEAMLDGIARVVDLDVGEAEPHTLPRQAQE